jgi:RNA polymerase sigma-70 factor (ECF subfamily)
VSHSNSKPARAVAQFVARTFRQYGLGLHRYLERRLPTPQDADDMAQEVYLRLLRLDDAELVREPQAYLYGVASNVVREFRMHAELERERMTFDSETADAQSERASGLAPDGLADHLSLVRQLEGALRQLPPAQRAIIVLLKRDGLTYEEAAERMGLSWWTVEKYYHQAKVKLRSLPWER